MLSLYGWILHTPALNPVEKDIDPGRKIVQLDSGSEISRSEPQHVSFGPSPSAPFDYYCQTQSEELLPKLPLETLNLLTPLLIPDIQ